MRTPLIGRSPRPSLKPEPNASGRVARLPSLYAPDHRRKERAQRLPKQSLPPLSDCRSRSSTRRRRRRGLQRPPHLGGLLLDPVAASLEDVRGEETGQRLSLCLDGARRPPRVALASDQDRGLVDRRSRLDGSAIPAHVDRRRPKSSLSQCRKLMAPGEPELREPMNQQDQRSLSVLDDVNATPRNTDQRVFDSAPRRWRGPLIGRTNFENCSKLSTRRPTSILGIGATRSMTTSTLETC